MSSTKENSPDVAVNRQARHEFFIEAVFEAGMVLQGSEVKSIRKGSINLKEGYARIHANELFLEGVHISPYDHAGKTAPESVRTRKLLMHRREIRLLADEISQKRLTLVPLRVYFKGGRAKIELGLAKGKKQYDKREAIKKAEAKRMTDRAQKIRRQ